MTALDAQVKATGLIAYKALIDHAIDNGLQAPVSLEVTDQHVKVWLSASGSTKWVDSIHVDDEHVREGAIEGREIVHIDGRTPLLGIKVQLRFSRTAIPAAYLRAVTA